MKKLEKHFTERLEEIKATKILGRFLSDKKIRIQKIEILGKTRFLGNLYVMLDADHNFVLTSQRSQNKGDIQ